MGGGVELLRPCRESMAYKKISAENRALGNFSIYGMCKGRSPQKGLSGRSERRKVRSERCPQRTGGEMQEENLPVNSIENFIFF
jgi:hypothetical protein